VESFLSRLRAIGANFSAGQLVSLALSFILVVAIVGGSAMWLNTPSYTLLFADMDPESAGQVVTRLKSLNVPYQLDEGGGAIRVPRNRVDELRLELTAQGLPSSGRIGFEIFDRTTFGATDFVEQVNYRRALEGEIARTIGTISEVAGARVHIALGKDSLFGEKRLAKASVVLKLRGQRTSLSEGTVAGISNLVAASVEGLKPESVVIIDSAGRPLSQPADESGLSNGGQLERQQRLEHEMSTRVIALLEPVVGEGRVRVNVALMLNPKSRELTEERWDPTTVLRSRSVSADTSTLAGGIAGGIAGARANLPATNATPPPVSPVLPNGPGSSRQTETTNYEVSRTTTRTLEPPGDVARLSVAVILDNAQETTTGSDGKTTVARVARKPEELQKLQALVAAAVGMNETRGDLVTVENVSFEEHVASEPEPPTFWTRWGPTILDGGRTIAVLVIGLVALLFVVRPMTKRMAAARPKVAAAAATAAMNAAARPRTVAELTSDIDAEMDAALAAKVGEGRRLPVLTRRAVGIAQKEPANTAKLIRSWMAE
jgi:flagellar M-ring protein FliF